MTFFLRFATCFLHTPMLLERKMKKIQKKAAPDPLFLERYLFGDDHRLKKNFVKKFKKIPQWDDFWKDTCSGRFGQNTGFRKEKSKKA